MDSELQNNTVSSTTSSQSYEELPTARNETSSLQVNKITSTVTSDAEAMILSLID